MRRCCVPLAVALPTSGPLCGRCHCPCGRTGAATPRVVAPAGAMPVVASLAGWCHPRRGRLVGATVGATPVGASHARGQQCLLAAALAVGGYACWRPWPLSTVGGHPYRGRGHGRPPLQVAWPWLAAPPLYVHYKNIARTRRMILRNSISSHAF
ncbi:hypothetical protein BHE74_00012125 [Ensete ventricosum]|nr:hypothetical protein BHE74_00012125 [Ensete ventricosum]